MFCGSHTGGFFVLELYMFLCCANVYRCLKNCFIGN